MNTELAAAICTAHVYTAGMIHLANKMIDICGCPSCVLHVRGHDLLPSCCQKPGQSESCWSSPSQAGNREHLSYNAFEVLGHLLQQTVPALQLDQLYMHNCRCCIIHRVHKSLESCTKRLKLEGLVGELCLARILKRQAFMQKRFPTGPTSGVS